MTSRDALGVGLTMLLGGCLIFAVARPAHLAQNAGQALVATGTVQAVGKALFTTYVFPFEMVSLVLLPAAVGAVVLTKRHLQ
jgi:NADH-quinone oxidoreductase subunit J